MAASDVPRPLAPAPTPIATPAPTPARAHGAPLAPAPALALILALLLLAAEQPGGVATGLGAAAVQAPLRVVRAQAAAGANSSSSSSSHAAASLNFLAVALDADGSAGYERFLPSYAAFALAAQPRAVAELVVASAQAFEAEHAGALRVLQRAFPGRLLVRDAATEATMLSARLTQQGWRNTARFLEEPHLVADVTYMGDVDVMIVLPRGGGGAGGSGAAGEAFGSFSRGDAAAVDDIAAEHLAHMSAFSPPLPYSNVLRTPEPQKGGEWRQLTGLHAVRSAAYYDSAEWRATLRHFSELPAEDAALRMVVDTVALQRLCARAFGLPERATLAPAVAADEAAARRALTWRPVWGIHISPSRGRGRSMLNRASCGQCRAAADVATQPWYGDLLSASPAAAAVQQQLERLCACCGDGDAEAKECSMRLR